MTVKTPDTKSAEACGKATVKTQTAQFFATDPSLLVDWKSSAFLSLSSLSQGDVMKETMITS
jgi:hypothetical protein